MRTLPAYVTRDVAIEARRAELHQLHQRQAAPSASGISPLDAQLGLRYAEYVWNRNFTRELNESRPEGMRAFPEIKPSVGMPLGDRGRVVYEQVLAELKSMERFGLQTLKRAMIERFTELGAK